MDLDKKQLADNDRAAPNRDFEFKRSFGKKRDAEMTKFSRGEPINTAASTGSKTFQSRISLLNKGELIRG